ncbi:FAD-dependent monooxygenase [Caulobacter segnis]|uniref:Salicylate 1-monooxygenase n=1 Tax=Caulobacter segnis TaxID=88688 RepID=A0A2W5WPS7_9CAUL|nr:FAD-dependent monooxygenase [Caulobacter segnis]PZR36078.1 MAG: salicylate 1-monooxygenase [Caulobacter segnis]
MNPKPSIVIIGGGIGGLSAGVGLARAGYSVDIFEAAPAWADIGAGVTLAPNAMKGFQFLGLGDAVAKAGVEPKAQTIRHWQDNRLLFQFERGDEARQKYGAPYVYIHRADLHTILVKAAQDAGARLHIGRRVERVGPVEGGAELVLEDGETFRADLLIGADGVKSVVRKLFEEAKPHFTGHVCYRALIPVTPTVEDLAKNPGMHIGPSRMMVRYPVRNSEILNLVFFIRQAGWEDDGWTIPATKAELSAAFEGWCPDIHTMIAQIDESRLYKWAINARKPLPTWRVGDHITLLGDAAHAMTPFLGQGAAAGIEDAVVLVRALDASSSLDEALTRYEKARHERASFIQLESNANADRMQGQETDTFGLGGLKNEETLGLFDYDAATVEI